MEEVDTVNNKGSFKNDGSVGKKILRFFKESGFYIAIVVGLCALAAGAVFFSTNQILTDPDKNAEDDNQLGIGDENRIGFLDDGQGYLVDIPDGDTPDQSYINSDEESNADYQDPDIGVIEDESGDSEEPGPVGQAEIPEQPDQVTKTDSGKTADSDAEAAQTSGGIGVEDDTAPAEDVVLAIVKPNLQPPVQGKVQAAYSMDKLVFSPTFNEWRTHSGVDISAPRGEVVRAAGNGVILEIKNDPRYGFTIVIDHKNGYKSLYANLASDKTMTVGKEVKMGDPIGSVGATAIFESAEPTHIHFELFKENKLVDPAAYIDFPK